MKWRRIIWSRIRLQSIPTAIYSLLAILSVTLTESEGTRRSVENLQSLIKNENKLSALPNDSKNLKIGPEFGLSSIENDRNTPALNSFLKNVLRAQDELKWIDKAVRRVDAKKMQEKVPARYMRESRYTPGSRYRSKIRFKKRSISQPEDENSWTSSKRFKYNNDDDNSERIYLDDEMKVKRNANPNAEFDDQGYRSSMKGHCERSVIDDREPIDDSNENGFQVSSNGWFESGEQNDGKFHEAPVNDHWSSRNNNADHDRREIFGSNKMEDFSKRVEDEFIDNPRNERDAHSSSVIKGAEEPTLESLRKTVLELRKSLDDSDKKMDALNAMNEMNEMNEVNEMNERKGFYGGVKNRERNVEDTSGGKEGRGKGERERNIPSLINDDKVLMNKKFGINSRYDPSTNWYEESEKKDEEGPSSSKMEISGTNWWDDPRSAIDMFDFKKRDDDSDDEDDDEDLEPINSEFDYMTRRVKRDKDIDGGEEKLRVYRRAGFGELYPENEKNVGKKLKGSKKDTVRVYREIKKEEEDDVNLDKINVNGVKSGDRKSADINVNENGHSGSFGSDDISEIKNLRDDNNNSTEKSGVLKNVENGGLQGKENVVAGTIGDLNLKEKKKPGLFLSANEKRFETLEDREGKHEHDEIQREIDLTPKNMELGVDKLSKTLPIKPNAEGNLSNENNLGEKEKKEVEKSEPNDDNDVHKLTRESNDDKKHEDEEKKDAFRGQREEEKVLSLGETKRDEKGMEIKNDDEVIKLNNAKLDVNNSGEKITDEIHGENESENLDNVQNSKFSGNKINLGNEGESKIPEVSVNSEISHEGDNQDSKTVKLAERGIPSTENKETDQKDLNDKDKSEIRDSGHEDEAKIEKDVTSGSKESSEKLMNEKNNKQKENYGNEKQQDSHVYEIDKKMDKKNMQNLDSEVNNSILKREDLTRKLLWLSEKSPANGESKIVEIRDGRRDSSWDQNRGEKSGQRPANFLKNTQIAQNRKNNKDELKFIKRSLMVADSGFGDKFDQLEKRSLKSYPENAEDENNAENIESDLRRKRSDEKIIENEQEPDNLAEDSYEIEDDGVVAQNDDDFKDPVVNKEGNENQKVESDGQSQSSSVHLSSNKYKDRDPMRDRINMLIKQKLDDREKGRLTHFKREAINYPVANIEYYDYDHDVNPGDSDADSTAGEHEQDNIAHYNASNPLVVMDPAPMTKTDEAGEDEMRKEKENEENHQEPKEEFISDVELLKTRTLKPPASKISANGMEDVLQENEENDQVAKSNNHWLGEPVEGDSDQEQDTIDRPNRYQDSMESGEHKKSLENEKEEVLEEPLEYSVNVRGKLDPESIGAMIYEKGNAEEKESSNDNENSDDKLGIDNDDDDDDSKYEGIRSKSNDDFRRDSRYSEKLYGRDWRYKDSARIGEGTNDRESLQNSLSHNVQDRKLYSKEISEDEDVPSSREARLVESFGQDSLPTMLDRSGPRSLASGERTYLVIAPPKFQYRPQKQNDDNSSSSSSSPSGSNYLALKVTDDLFKGGIEQSNPIEDDNIPDNNFMGKTTTEWKIIKMGDNARMNLMPNKIVKIDSNLLENPSIDPRDDVHESIVDPEEMAGDFDDDTRPRFGRDLKSVWESHRRFGRSLQSISYPINPFDQVHIESGEKPVDKYLENSQTSFESLEMNGHRIGKRSALVDDKGTENLSKSNDESLHDEDNGADKIAELKIPILNTEKKNANLMGMIKLENSEKRSLIPDCGNDTDVDEDKRGLTNVEEWEMNSPTVQKQHLISTIQNGDESTGNLAEKATLGIRTVDSMNNKKNTEFKSTQKTLKPNFHDTVTSAESHEREIRSVKLSDENFKSDLNQASHEFGNKKRSKVRKTKPHDEFRELNSAVPDLKSFPKYASSLDSNPGYSYDEENDKSLGDSVVDYNNDRKKLNPVKNIEGKRHQLNNDEHWESKSSLGHRKSVKEDRSNHKHNKHTSIEKHHNNNNNNNKKALKSKDIGFHGGRESLRDSTDSSTPLRSMRGPSKERNFKEIEGNPVMHRGKANNRIIAGGISHLHTQLQSKSFENGKEEGGQDESGNGDEEEKRVLDENAEDLPKPQIDETQKKKFTVLLAADNMEDESQMDLALHGELAGKIVERIFDQVQKNDALKLALGPGLYRKHKSEDAIASDKIYREGLDEDEVKHTEGMMRRVMELLGRLILDEVQRKTCASLPPDMREFLQWMLGVEDDDKATDQVPPLPFVHNQEPNHRQDDKFLFEDSATHNENAGDIDELNKKVRLLKGLINEYNSLTDKEKIKVQTVHDYLVKQLQLLLDHIDTEENENGGTPQAMAIGDGNILQYQNAVPNPNGSSIQESTLSPLVNTPSILMLSNASFIEHPTLSNHLLRSRFREARSSQEDEVEERRRKKRKHRKHKRHHSKDRERRKYKHKKHKKKNKNKKKKHPAAHKNHKDAQSPEYKKLIRRASMLRKKRANLYEDNWDPIDSGYEEPRIYTSSGELTNKRKRSLFKKKFEDEGKLNDPQLWADAISGKLEGDEEFDGRVNSNVKKKKKKSVFDQLQDLESWNLNQIRNSRETDFLKNLNSGDSKNERDSSSAEESKNEKSAKPDTEIKRDVLSASIALQPWINPKPDDLVSSKYLKEITNELVHGSQAPPAYPGDRIDGDKKKREIIIPRMTEGRHLVDDEVMLLSKRDAWKAKNEQQLEEVAFGKDMRGKWKEKEEFEKLTEIDRKKNPDDISSREKREGSNTRNSVFLKSEKEAADAVAIAVAETMKNIGDKISDDEKDPVKNNQGIHNLNAGEIKKENYGNTRSNVTLDFEKSENAKSLGTGSDAESLAKIEMKDDKKIVEGPKEIDKIESNEENTEEEEEERRLENLKITDRTDKKLEQRNNKRSSSSLVTPEIEGSAAILPLLEISEQRQQQKEAAKTEKDDQRDIADQMLGFESPLIKRLNTY